MRIKQPGLISGLSGLARRLRGARGRSETAYAPAPYVLALEKMTDAVAVADEDGVIRYANSAFSRVFAAEGADLIGADLLAATGGEENVSVFPARDEKGREAGYAAIVRDTSEARRLEGQLRQAQKMEAVGRLAGGVAHDFNNLLTIINGYAELALLATDRTTPSFPHLREIRKAGEQAAELTRRLLAVGRSQVLQPRLVDINTLILDLIGMVRPLLGGSIQVVTSLDPDAGRVYLDAGQLRQALLNLMVNARDAMPEGGLLLVETATASAGCESVAGTGAPSQDCLMISVTDDGMGMDENTKAHVFEPFFTTKAPGAGTGLGLSSTFGIVKQSGGSIQVDSAPGKGSTFRLYFPRCRPLEPQGDAARLPAPPHGENSSHQAIRPGNETVLTVSDDESVRTLVSSSLELYGYTVLGAKNRAEAELTCQRREGAIDLLLVDAIVPGAAAQELAQSIRRLRPGIRVLHTSGYPEDAMPRRGGLSSGGDCLVRPFTPQTLARKIREMLDRPMARGRVLLTDDEPGVRQLLAGVLGAAGYEVLLAADGDEALEAVRNNAPDLVIMDLVMPGREGLETIAEVRRLAPGTKIMAISGAFGSRFLSVATHLGADAALAKPIAGDVLLDAVKGVLAGETGKAGDL